MLKHPASAKTVFTNVRSSDYQPNAVDIRVHKILAYASDVVELSEEHKVHRTTFELEPSADGSWVLPYGSSFEVVFENDVVIGEGEAGWVIPRSTLNRNGIMITSGLYDSGYSGVIGATIHTGSTTFKLKQGTRIAQFILIESQSVGVYNGSYGHGKEHDQKYVK